MSATDKIKTERINLRLTQQAKRAGGRQAVARFRRRRDEWAPVSMSVEEILQARHEEHRF